MPPSSAYGLSTRFSVVFSTVPSDFSTVLSFLTSVEPSDFCLTDVSSETVRSQPTSTGVPKSDATNNRLNAVRFMVRSFQLCLSWLHTDKQSVCPQFT